MIRCAIYSRYSSDMQREASIEDQERNCRKETAKRGWTINEALVKADKAKSGATLRGRHGLQELIAAAKMKPRPFDYLLVDDMSRLSRYQPEQRLVIDTLRHHGVGVLSATEQIDSLNPAANTQIMLTGFMAEQQLTGHRDKVRRGQEGRALRGCITGGRRYGYRNKPVEDPTRRENYGRPAVIQVDLEIEPSEAKVMLRIFGMYADGTSPGRIAKQLNAEGIRGPKGQWSASCIREMLRKELYRGLIIWGRTTRSRDPETGKKPGLPVPEEEWVRVEKPELRIIPEDLWLRVQTRRRANAEDFQRRGGMTRTERARSFLFSGKIVCANCDRNMAILAGGRERPPSYGCLTRKLSGTCDNNLMIRQDRLEAQILAALEKRVLTPANLERTVQRCEQQLRERLAQMEREGSIPTLESLKKQWAEAERKLNALLDFIERGGGGGNETPASLMSRVRAAQAEVKRLDAELAAHRHQPIKSGVAVGSVRDQIVKCVTGLRETMRDKDVARAKDAIDKYVGKLVLTPVQRDGRRVYRVSGNVSFRPVGGNCRMHGAALEGRATTGASVPFPWRFAGASPLYETRAES
jgi:DNA invertase Pin-like site-specific DNA recombinase